VQFCGCLWHVKQLLVERRVQHGQALLQCRFASGLVAGAKHHAVNARLRGAARLAKASGQARQVEQLDHAVLQHMAHPGATLQPLAEAAFFAHTAVVRLKPRQQHQQTVGKTGQGERRMLFQLAKVEPDLHRGAVGPAVATPEKTVPQPAQGKRRRLHEFGSGHTKAGHWARPSGAVVPTSKGQNQPLAHGSVRGGVLRPNPDEDLNNLRLRVT
jgi:hypothetical protein